MAQTIKLRRSATTGNVPTTAQLALGEVALNTFDGRAFIKKNDGSDSIQHLITTNSETTGSINLIGNITASGNISSSGAIIGDTLTGSLNIPNNGTLGIGQQTFYPHGANGFSVNENFDASNSSTQTAYHYTSGDAARSSVVFSIARTSNFTNMFGVTGSSSDNKFVIGAEFANTDFEWRKSLGIQPVNLQGGTLLARLDRSGSFYVSNDITASGNVDTQGILSIPGFINVSSSLASLTAATSSYLTSETYTGTVDTSGTPSANQVAIFADSDTILGDTGLTYNIGTDVLDADGGYTIDGQIFGTYSAGQGMGFGEETNVKNSYRAQSHLFTTPITASIISASGDLYGYDVHASNNFVLYNNVGVINETGGAIGLGNNSYSTSYKGTSHTFGTPVYLESITKASGAITASGGISASFLEVGTNDANGGAYSTVMVDTATGRFYHTGSYGGGGGGGGGGISFNGSTANGVVTYGGATTADVESNLTFDGTSLKVTGNITASNDISASNSLYALNIWLGNQKFANLGVTTQNFEMGSGGEGSLILTNITASGAISASSLILTNITASGAISASGVIFANLVAGTDNSVVVKTTTGELKTDEIDSRVWGSTLVDYTGTPSANSLAIWSDINTLAGQDAFKLTNVSLIQLNDADTLPGTTGFYVDVVNDVAGAGGNIFVGDIASISSSFSTTAGYLYNLNGSWSEALADNPSTSTGFLGVATETGTSNTFLTRGYYNVTSSYIQGTYVQGAPVYINAGAGGKYAFTPPSATGSVSRIIGHAVDTFNELRNGYPYIKIHFNPSPDWIEI